LDLDFEIRAKSKSILDQQANIINHKVLTMLMVLASTTIFRTTQYNNNNNQAFYSQTSWGRLEMKPHEPKKRVQNKSKKEGENKGR
jgi:hypothetical protein